MAWLTIREIWQNTSSYEGEISSILFSYMIFSFQNSYCENNMEPVRNSSYENTISILMENSRYRLILYIGNKNYIFPAGKCILISKIAKFGCEML